MGVEGLGNPLGLAGALGEKEWGTLLWETVGCQQGHPKMPGHFAEEGIYIYFLQGDS